MKVARVYKRTQVVVIVVDDQGVGKLEDRFDSEVRLVTDAGWTTLDDSVRWMDG